MKIPEIVVKVDVVGALWLANDQGDLDCPFDVGSGSCGSWCPHFEVSGVGVFEGDGLTYAKVRLFCTPRERDFPALRVVEPENKETTP